MKSVTAVILSQSLLFLTLLVCVFISPSVVFNLPQGGLSNFGTEAATLAIFSVGFWGAIALLFYARTNTNSLRIRKILIMLCLLMSALVLSTYPYKLSNFFENIHIAIGFAVALYQFGCSYYFLKQNNFDFASKLACVFLVLSVVCSVSTIFFTGLLFSAQLLGGMSFGLVLIRAMQRVNEP